MPLIIDSYEVPAITISKSIFKKEKIHELVLPVYAVSNPDSTIYYIHRENECDLRNVKYFFNEIVEVRNNLIYINKKKKNIKYYLITREDNSISISEIVEEKINHNVFVDKSDFLPHLKAQENEIVIFPSEEDDDD